MRRALISLLIVLALAVPGWAATITVGDGKTHATAPGFAGGGTVWETDGTDEGTSSDYYRLAVDAPARTTGEGGTYCGAFEYEEGAAGAQVIVGS